MPSITAPKSPPCPPLPNAADDDGIGDPAHAVLAQGHAGHEPQQVVEIARGLAADVLGVEHGGQPCRGGGGDELALDDDLAETFDALLRERAYRSRSEAMRDLLRGSIEQWRQESSASEFCIASLPCVFDRRVRNLAQRLTEFQHDGHDSAHAHHHHEPYHSPHS